MMRKRQEHQKQIEETGQQLQKEVDEATLKELSNIIKNRRIPEGKEKLRKLREVVPQYIKDLEKNVGFKELLHKTIQVVNNINLIEIREFSDNYQRNLEEKSQKDKLNNFAEQFIEIGKQIQSQEPINKTNDKKLLAIEEKFPVEMTKTRTIFAFLEIVELICTKDDSDLGDLLSNLDLQQRLTKIDCESTQSELQVTQSQELSEFIDIQRNLTNALGLDYNSLKKFFSFRDIEKCKTEVSIVLHSIGLDEIEREIIEFQPKLNKTVDEEIKSLEQLLNEMEGEADETLRLIKEDKDMLASLLGKIKQNENIYSVRDINQWAIQKKGRLGDTDDEICEAIVMMNQAYCLLTGNNFRDAQIIATLLFLKDENNKGKLCQISTGEGKTTIVSMLAVIRVLQGKTVDIITSNSVLAEEGVREKLKFYRLFDISVDHNKADEKYTYGPRDCYKAEVVYGDIGNFQFDYLRHDFEDFKTFGYRRFDNTWAILDEVDSMIVDNGGHIAKLAQPVPGFEQLRYVYIKIWQELCKAEVEVLNELEKDLQKAREQGEEVYSNKIEQLLDNDKATIELTKEKIIKVFEEERRQGKKLLGISNGLPRYLEEYAQRTLRNWIDNAISAKYHYQKNNQYKISIDEATKEPRIVPIDNENTGVTLGNTILSCGVHQFLELKHNLFLTYESLTSSYISNFGYIKLYGTKLSGLTGTLGSQPEQALMSKMYNVDYAKVPTYKEKIFFTEPSLVIEDDAFINEVAIEVLRKAFMEKRAVLIICATVQDLLDLNQKLQEYMKTLHLDDNNVRLYHDENSVDQTREPLNIGDIIISTNIGGRGTDLKTTKELNDEGGLHVIKAFLPYNQRVEDQADGRTSRQGNLGTTQLIIRQSEVEALNNNFEQIVSESSPVKKLQLEEYENFERIKEIRYELERLRIERIKQIKLKELEFGDVIFKKFTKLYIELKGGNTDQYVLKDLKEFWAYWLEKNKCDKQELELLEVQRIENKAQEKFDQFKNEAREIIEHHKIIHNPYYSIQQADYHLDDGNSEKAIMALENAISIGGEALYSAYIKLFEAIIESGKQLQARFWKAMSGLFFVETQPTSTDYKSEALKWLQKAKEALEPEYNYLFTVISPPDVAKEELKDKYIEEATEDFQLILAACSYNNKKQAYLNGISIPTIATIAKSDFWYSDEDMHKLGTYLLKQYIDVNTQFKNRLTFDGIEGFCKDQAIEDSKPIFISYNIGGKITENSGVHWVAIVIIKIDKEINVLFKDPKGDFGQNYTTITSKFMSHFKQRYSDCNIKFKQHSGQEQYDSNSCGPRTLENLAIIAQKLQENAANEVVRDFVNIRFPDEYQYRDLIDQFKRLSIVEQKAGVIQEENYLLKHLQSRLQCLATYKVLIDNLIDEVKKSKNNEDGLTIAAKVNPYLGKLNQSTSLNKEEQKLKGAITSAEAMELDYIKFDTMYATKVVHDVNPEIIENAQLQIAGGMSALAVGLAFPPLMPFAGPISGLLISEGILDIVMDLISQGNCEFDREAYNKSKAISYAISIATMGLAAIAMSTKILNAAIKVCRGLANFLKKIPFMKSVFEKIAVNLDKLAIYLSKMVEASKFAKLSQIDQLNKLESLKALKQFDQVAKLEKLTKLLHLSRCAQVANVMKGVAINVVTTVVIERATSLILNPIMAGLKPMIKENVLKIIKEKINHDKIRSIDKEKIMELTREVLNGGSAAEIAKEISLGIAKGVGNWKIQAIVCAIDSIISIEKMCTYASKFCDNLNKKLALISLNSTPNNIYDIIIEQISEIVSECIYSLAVSFTSKTLVTVPSIAIKAYKANKAKEVLKKRKAELREEYNRASPEEQARMHEIHKDILKQIGATNSQEAACVHAACSEVLEISAEETTLRAKLAASFEGATIENAKHILKAHNIEAHEYTMNNVDTDALKRHLQNHDSDRAVLFMTNTSSDAPGHATAVFNKDDNLWVKDTGKDVLLTEYMQTHSGGEIKVLVPKACRSQNMRDIKNGYNKINIIYGEKMSSTKGGGGEKFGIDQKTAEQRVFRDAEQDKAKIFKKKIEAEQQLLNAQKNGLPTKELQEQVESLTKQLDEARKHTEDMRSNPSSIAANKVKEAEETRRNQAATAAYSKAIKEIVHEPTWGNQAVPNDNQVKGMTSCIDAANVKELNLDSVKSEVITMPGGWHCDIADAGGCNKIEIQHIKRGGGGATIAQVTYPKGELTLKEKTLILNLLKQGVRQCETRGNKNYCSKLNYLPVFAPQASSSSDNKKRGPADKIKIRKSEMDYWFDYTENGLKNLLELRLMAFHEFDNNTKVLNPIDFCRQDLSSLSDSLNTIQCIFTNDISIGNILIPIVIRENDIEDSCHWVGIVLKRQNNNIEISYLDSENRPISSHLKNSFMCGLGQLNFEYKISFNQIIVEQQRYNNCGPELLENFIYYLTGNRLPQESAVYEHSILFETFLLHSNAIEQPLLFFSANKTQSHLSISTPIDENEQRLVGKFYSKLRFRKACL